WPADRHRRARATLLIFSAHCPTHRHQSPFEKRHPSVARLFGGSRNRDGDRAVTLLEAMADQQLFARWFRDPATWASWRAFIAALFALHMTAEQQLIFEVYALRERKPPFSPEDVVAEFSELLKSYRVSKIAGDRYAGEWPLERF